MKIELRNVKTAQWASEETNCFAATVYIDGVAYGTVHNDGHGGPNSYGHPGLKRMLDDYGATLPKLITKYPDSKSTSGFWELQYDADLLIGDALEVYAQAQQLKRRLKTKVVFIHDNKVWEMKFGSAEKLGHVASWIKIKHPGAEILNYLPFEAALERFGKCA